MNSGKTTVLRRFEYGRHETFAIRQGWLGKGLSQLEATGSFEADTATADRLGLGSRMVKSLAYWLEASALATARVERRSRKLATSEVGRVIRARDAHFEYAATWWFVHLAVASRDGSVMAWFFNDYVERSFERAGCVEAYLRQARQYTKAPTQQTAQRDVACVLASYSKDPTEPQDPEDATTCPLVDLGLVTYHRDTRRFEKVRPLDPVPPEVFLAAAARCGRSTGDETLAVSDLATRRHGPGRLLGLSPDMIDRAADEAARLYAKNGVTYVLLGTERRLRVPDQLDAWWLAQHFDRIEASA
jgi:hypothetical protein